MNFLDNLPKQTNFNPEASLTTGALAGSTLIINSQGELSNLEELACLYDCKADVLSLDSHGRMTTSAAYGFRIGEWVSQLVKITLDNGHIIEATKNQLFLTPSGTWLPAKELSFGTVLSTAIYNPKNRHPSKALNEVVHVHMKPQAHKIPAYSFNVKPHQNLLIAQELADGSISLVPAHAGLARN